MSRKWITAYIILIGILIEVTWIAGVISGPAFTNLLHLSNTQLGIVLGALNIGLFVFSPVAGKISSQRGSQKVLLLGLLGMIVGVCFVIIGTNYAILLLGMLITGIANAFVINANMTILANLFPDMIRRIISLYSALYFGGCAICSPLIGQWLKISMEKGWYVLSYRVPFLILLLIFIYFVIVVHRFIIPSISQMTLTGQEKIENKTEKEKLPGFSKWFWVPVLSFLHGLMYIVMVSWISPMAKERFGANEFQGSLFVGVVTMGMGIGRLSIAALKLPWDDRNLLSFGTIIGGLLFFAGFFVPSYFFSLSLVGLGSFIASTSFPCISSLAGDLFPEARAKIFGYMYATYAIGGILGTPFAGMLTDWGIELSWVLTISAWSALLIGAISLLWRYIDKGMKEVSYNANSSSKI